MTADAPQPTAGVRTAHLILGVPRSGTSAVAQLLSDAGLSFGDPAHFLDTTVHTHNPSFFELGWVNELNNLAVLALGSQYADDFLPVEADFADPALDDLRERIAAGVAAEFGDAPRICVKDPRFCFTFPLWRDVLGRLGYAVSAVVVVRSEAAARRSNRALEPKWADDRAWSRFYLQSLLAARHFTRGVPTAVVDYDALMADPPAYAAGLGERLGLAPADVAVATARLDPVLVHQRPTDAADDSLTARAQRDLRDGRLPSDAYLDYRAVASLHGGDPAPVGVRAARAEAVELQRERDGLRLHAEQLTAVIADKQHTLEHHERHAAEMQRQRDGLRLHAEQLTAVVADKQFALEHHERHAAEMQRQRDGLRLHAEQLNAVIADKQFALEHHERHAAEMQRQRDGLHLHAEQLTAVIADKQRTLEHHERHAAEMQRQRDGLRLHAEQLTAVIADKQLTLEHHERRADAAEAGVRQRDRDLAAARAESGEYRSQRAVLLDVLRQVWASRSWRWSAPFRRGGRPPLTEAQLRPITPVRHVGPDRWASDGPAQFILPCLPVVGQVRVELTLWTAGPTHAHLYWDTGRLFNADQHLDLGPADGHATFTADVRLTEPAHCFRLDPVDRACEFEVSRLRLFCVGP